MNSPNLKGLTAYIMTNPLFAGCSSGGVSAHVTKVTVVGTVDRRWPIPTEKWHDVKPLARGSQIFTPTDEAPAVVLVYRNMGAEQVVSAEPWLPPEAADPHPVQFMAGGSVLDGSDSRWRELVGFYGAVSFHDRSEFTPDYYAKWIAPKPAEVTP